MPDFENYELN